MPVGPKQAALADLWRQVSARKLWAPPTFWRWWALRRRMSLRQLSASEITVVGPPPPLAKVNDCRNCLDSCCVGRRATVLLRLQDIAMLMDVGRETLISRQKPHFSPAELVGRPALAAQVSARSWEIFPVLAQNSMHACRALNTEGRCTLYPAWPLSCARFPWSLDVEAQEVFYSPRCPSYWVRDDAQPALHAMRAAAVAAYNARVQDAILLQFARPQLAEMGMLRHLVLDDVEASA